MAEIWYQLHHLQDPQLQLNMVDDDLTSMRSVSSEDVSMGSCCCCPKGGDPKAKIRRQCQMLQVSVSLIALFLF